MGLAKPAIQFENVSKRFTFTPETPQSVLETIIDTVSGRKRRLYNENDLWALRDLSFDVQPGQCLGIIGRNGSGKSTALKMVARILRPTAGRVVVRGRVSALLELGAGFHEDLTGRENIFLNASVLGLSRATIMRSFDSIVAFSELGEFINMPVKHYSSGMYMRLGFSIAIHVDPDILIVDEILAVGDQAFQQKCVEHIYAMKREGTTIVIVSHNANTVRDICTDLVWLENGRLRAAGPVNHVLPEYVAHYDQEKQASGPMSRSREATTAVNQPKMTLQAVHLTNSAAQPTSSFQTGDDLCLEVAYVMSATGHSPRFEFAIYRNDGVLVTATQRELAQLQPTAPALVSSGVVGVTFPRLPLLPADYRLQTAVYQQDELLAILETPFRMVADSAQAHKGLLALPATWLLAPGEPTEGPL